MRLCAVCRHDLGDDDFCIACFVRESCEQQGVPYKVTDPAVIRQVVALLGGPLPSKGRGRR